MKLKQIDEIIEIILSIPVEEYTNRCSFDKGKYNINWNVYNYYCENSKYQININIYKSNNYVDNISFPISEEKFNLLKERAEELGDYFDNKFYNIICNDSTNC